MKADDATNIDEGRAAVTKSYQYVTNDHPDNPVSKALGAGVEVAVITVQHLNMLRSCRDFVEACRRDDTVLDAAGRLISEVGDDAPVLDVLRVAIRAK